MRFHLLFPIVALTAPALAQDATPDDDVQEIVVTGYGLTAGVGDAAYDVVTIDRERLVASASGRIEDVLRDAAGFQQFRRSDARSAHPTSQGATLRGLGGNASSRALVLLDGVPQIDPFGGWVNWTALDPVRLGQVRVTRGGGSGVAGPGALAGTIELSSAGARDLQPLWGGLAYGSRDSVDADAGVSGRIGGGFGTLSGSYARGDGFVPVIASQRGPADVGAEYEQYSVSARAVAPIGATTELQAMGLAFHDARNRGLAFTDNQSDGADASVRLIGRGKWGWEALAYLQLRDFSSGFASADAATRSVVTPSLDQYRVPALGKGARFEIRPPLGDGIELRLGSDWRDLSGRTQERFLYVAGEPTERRQTGGSTTTLGAFADASLRAAEGLTLTGGARVDRWWIRQGYLTQTNLTPQRTDYQDRSGTRPTGRAGIAYQPTRAITLRSAGYLGWRLPTLNELYRPFRVGQDSTAANPDLSPERVKGVDAGIDYRPLANVQLSATVFWNRLTDGIANVTQSTTPAGAVNRRRENIGAIRARGFEADARLGWAAWQLSASYAYVDARVRDDQVAPDLDGLRPAQTPRHQASATIAWNRGVGPTASLSARYVASQFEDDQNIRRLDDAITVDAVATLPITERLSIEARAENIADARVEAAVSGLGVIERATPRTLWLGVRYGGR
jgi:outer membrane receptor protein involved in Fe transport